MSASMTQSACFSVKITKTIIKDRYFIAIPVFGINDAWKALKIADRKLYERGYRKIEIKRAVSAIPQTENNYLCTFEFQSMLSKDALEKLLKWNVNEY